MSVKIIEEDQVDSLNSYSYCHRPVAGGRLLTRLKLRPKDLRWNYVNESDEVKTKRVTLELDQTDRKKVMNNE